MGHSPISLLTGSRLTSLELITLGVPSVMICDTMVGSLFQHHNIHAVIVGADRIAKNGDTANKVRVVPRELRLSRKLRARPVL